MNSEAPPVVDRVEVETPEPVRAHEGPSGGVFWPAVLLAVILVAAKGQNLHRFKGAEARQWWGDLAAVSATDVLFTAAWAILGAALLWGLRRQVRRRGWAFAAWMSLSVVFAVFGVVSVQVYEFLRTPLTYPLLYIANDLGNMRSSIGAFMTPRLVAALVLVPVSFVGVSVALNRWAPLPRGRWGGVVSGAALLLVAWQAWFSTQAMARWSRLPDRRLVQSPHWVFLRSCAEQVVGSGTVARLDGDYPAEFRGDFFTAAERGSMGQPPAEAASPPKARPKNVIIVVMESIGARHMGVYGSAYDTTPRLRAEMAHAAVFDGFHAHQGMSANSLFNMLTSTYTPISWMHFTLERPDAPGVSIAQVLKARGYKTAYMTSTDTKWADFRRFLSGRGFDSIADFRDMGGEAGKISSWTVEDRRLFDHGMKWVGENGDAPFFLMMWTGQGHHPYAVRGSGGQPLLEFVKEKREDAPSPQTLNQYLNVIRQTDHHLGRLLDFLRTKGLAEETLVVLTGDHGEAFGWPRPYFGHGLQIYQEIVHVPLILWNPRAFAGGGRFGTIAGQVDLGPTILDVLGLMEVPAGWQGRSLFDSARNGRVYFFAAGYDYLLGVREGSWKYILNATTGREELFDLQTDRDELLNVAEANAEQAKVFRQRLAAWADDQETRAGETAGKAQAKKKRKR